MLRRLGVAIIIVASVVLLPYMLFADEDEYPIVRVGVEGACHICAKRKFTDRAIVDKRSGVEDRLRTRVLTDILDEEDFQKAIEVMNKPWTVESLKWFWCLNPLSEDYIKPETRGFTGHPWLHNEFWELLVFVGNEYGKDNPDIKEYVKGLCESVFRKMTDSEVRQWHGGGPPISSSLSDYGTLELLGPEYWRRVKSGNSSALRALMGLADGDADILKKLVDDRDSQVEWTLHDNMKRSLGEVIDYLELVEKYPQLKEIRPRNHRVAVAERFFFYTRSSSKAKKERAETKLAEELEVNRRDRTTFARHPILWQLDYFIAYKLLREADEIPIEEREEWLAARIPLIREYEDCRYEYGLYIPGLPREWGIELIREANEKPWDERYEWLKKRYNLMLAYAKKIRNLVSTWSPKDAAIASTQLEREFLTGYLAKSGVEREEFLNEKIEYIDVLRKNHGLTDGEE